MNKNIQSDHFQHTQCRLVDDRIQEHQKKEMFHDADRRYTLWVDQRMQDAVEKFTTAQAKYLADLATSSARKPSHQHKKIDLFWRLCHGGSAGNQVPYLVWYQGQLVPVGFAPSNGLLFEISPEGDALRGLVEEDGAGKPAAGSLLNECVCYLTTQRVHHSEPLPVQEGPMPLSLSLALSLPRSTSPVNMQDMVNRLMHLVSKMGTNAVDMHLTTGGFGLLHIHIVQKYGSLCIVIKADNAAIMSSCMASTPALMTRLAGKHKKVRITICFCENEDGR